jgi:hypothetical protein
LGDQTHLIICLPCKKVIEATRQMWRLIIPWMKVMMKVVIPFHFIQKRSNENLYARGSTQNKNEKKG